MNEKVNDKRVYDWEGEWMDKRVCEWEGGWMNW